MTVKPLTKKDVEALQLSIDRLEKKVDSTHANLRKLERYLYDDDQTDSPGLVKQVRLNTSDIADLKEDKKFYNKLSFGMGAGGGTVIMGIYELIKYLKHL